MAKKKKTVKRAKKSKTPSKIQLRYRWVCESGHPTKRTGPYKKNYQDAREGGDDHDAAHHDGAAYSTVEASMG